MLGQIAKKTSVINSVSYTIAYAYDSYGRLSGETYPNGVVLSYSYDLGNDVAKIEAMVAGSWKTVISETTKDRPAQVLQYGNGLSRTVWLNSDDALNSIKTTGIQDLTYAYSAAGEITKITNGINTTATQTYVYDNASQLKTVTSGLGNESWTYDKNGNRTSRTIGSTEVYSISGANNQLSSIAIPVGTQNKVFGYDAVGNLTGWYISSTNVGNTFTYDAFNRLAT